MKPQNVSAWAMPGTVHWSSLRWPITSVASTLASRPGWLRTAATRSGAGWPVRATRYSHHSRRPAKANAATVRASPMMMRTATPASSYGARQILRWCRAASVRRRVVRR